jgi:hypothetical protein
MKAAGIEKSGAAVDEPELRDPRSLAGGCASWPVGSL